MKCPQVQSKANPEIPKVRNARYLKIVKSEPREFLFSVNIIYGSSFERI